MEGAAGGAELNFVAAAPLAIEVDPAAVAMRRKGGMIRVEVIVVRGHDLAPAGGTVAGSTWRPTATNLRSCLA